MRFPVKGWGVVWRACSRRRHFAGLGIEGRSDAMLLAALRARRAPVVEVALPGW